MTEYKNRDGIELSYTGDDTHTKLVKEVISEAVRMCSQYNWYDKTSMRFTLGNVKDFLIENFDLNNNGENDE